MLGSQWNNSRNCAMGSNRFPAWFGRLRAVVLMLMACVLFHGAPMPVAAQDEKLEKAGHLVGHGGPIRALAVDQRRARVLSGSFDYTMMLWQLDEGTSDTAGLMALLSIAQTAGAVLFTFGMRKKKFAA